MQKSSLHPTKYMSCGQIILPIEVAMLLLTKGLAGREDANSCRLPSSAGPGVAGAEGARTGLAGEASGGASAGAPAPVLGLLLRLCETDPGHMRTPMFVPTAAMYPEGKPRFPGIGFGEIVPSRTGTMLLGFV